MKIKPHEKIRRELAGRGWEKIPDPRKATGKGSLHAKRQDSDSSVYAWDSPDGPVEVVMVKVFEDAILRPEFWAQRALAKGEGMEEKKPQESTTPRYDWMDTGFAALQQLTGCSEDEVDSAIKVGDEEFGIPTALEVANAAKVLGGKGCKVRALYLPIQPMDVTGAPVDTPKRVVSQLGDDERALVFVCGPNAPHPRWLLLAEDRSGLDDFALGMTHGLGEGAGVEYGLTTTTAFVLAVVAVSGIKKREPVAAPVAAKKKVVKKLAVKTAKKLNIKK